MTDDKFVGGVDDLVFSGGETWDGKPSPAAPDPETQLLTVLEILASDASDEQKLEAIELVTAVQKLE
jgi:hypothetical protein